MLAACLCAALRARGAAVRAFKPVLTGVADEPDGHWPHDDELLALASGQEAASVAGLRFGAPVSPHLAAAGEPIDCGALVERARQLAAGADALIVEGAGGLLVPLRDSYTMRDLARELGLPVLVAARPGVGTINHTLLTLEALRAGGLPVAAVVLTPWPAQPDAVARSNRETVATLGATDVLTLPALAGPRPDLLARAGAPLVDRLLPSAA